MVSSKIPPITSMFFPRFAKISLAFSGVFSNGIIWNFKSGQYFCILDHSFIKSCAGVIGELPIRIISVSSCMAFFALVTVSRQYWIIYFAKGEITLWSVSVTLIVISFFIFDRGNYLTLAASLIGVTSLIFNAKGNPFGQFLMVIFSILYGIISFTFSYYGEMITYLGMTAPIAVFALISWLKNPYNGNRAEVKVNRLQCTFCTFLCC